MRDVRRAYPGITKAALAMAYDNGGINRDRRETDCLRELGEYLDEHWLRAEHLRVIDDWLNILPDAILETVCNGEDTEIKAALVEAPAGTDDLLNGIFDN